MREDLRFICETIDDNLRYAESKHTAFVVFNGVTAFGALGLMRNLDFNSGAWLTHLMLVTAICFLICAVMTSIYSFIPVIIQKKEARAESANDNALFFEHIKLHSAESYERLLCEKYQINPESITPLDRCIILQIIANAHLASRKFALFKQAAVFDLIAVAFAMVGTILPLVMLK